MIYHFFKDEDFTTTIPSILLFLVISVSFATNLGYTKNIGLELTKKFEVGVILDMVTWGGKITWSCISMAVDDFYAAHGNHTTRVVLHLKDSEDDAFSAASAGNVCLSLDFQSFSLSSNLESSTNSMQSDHGSFVTAAISLLNNLQIQAIIGPQNSAQAKMVAELGNKYQVPILSSATSPLLSSARNPYFIKTAISAPTRARVIADLVQSGGCTELVLIYEDSEYGTCMIPYLVNAFQTTEARITYHSLISQGVDDYQILRALSNLKTMQARAFVLHASNSLASRLVLKAREAGIIGEGYT